MQDEETMEDVIPNDKWFENEENQAKLNAILGIAPEERQLYSKLSADAKELEERKKALNSMGVNSIPPARTLGIPVAETNTEIYQPQVFTWEEFVNQPSNEQDWIIKGILRPGWLAVLGGHGKQGKTTLALHLLNALSQGQQFINNTIALPAIHLNFEMGESDIRELLKTISLNSPLKSNAKIINLIPAPLNLIWLESLLAKEELAGVCVIDSFRAAFMLSGDTENQAGTVGNILRKLQAIARKTKWSIIVIHHFRKSGTGEALDLAGSGEWLSAPDVIYTWSCPKAQEPGILNITGRVSPFEPLSLKLSREKIEFLGTVVQQTIESERQKVIESLTENPQKSDEIAEVAELPSSTVRKRLDELFKTGEVKRTGEGKRGNPYLWMVNPDL